MQIAVEGIKVVMAVEVFLEGIGVMVIELEVSVAGQRAGCCACPWARANVGTPGDRGSNRAAKLHHQDPVLFTTSNRF